MGKRRFLAKDYWILVYKYLVPQKAMAGLLACLILVGIGLQLAGPQVMRFFIDTAIGGGPMETLTSAAFLYLVLAIVVQVVSIFTNYVSEKVGWSATNNLRKDLLSHCLKQDIAFHKEHLPGELIEWIDGDTTALANLFTKFTVTVAANVLLILAMLVVLLQEDGLVGAGMSLFAVLALVLLVRIQALAVPHWVRIRKVRAEFFGQLGEHVTSVDEISANGAIPYVMNRFYRALRQWFPLTVKASMAGYAMWMSTIMVFAAGYATAFGLAGYLWKQGRITIGTAYLIFAYTNLLDGPIEQIRVQLEDLQKANASIRRIRDFLSIRPRIEYSNGLPLRDGALSVSMRDVSFAYAGEQTVLKSINIDIKPNRILGVIGRTGGGKTTLARLLCRFYDPDEGEISIGGIELKSVPLSSLREKVAYVTQDVQLLKASIRDNLTFFEKDADDRKLSEAIAAVGLSGWLSSLPQGLNTLLENEGAGLSAGQAQLLALARVFLRSPGLVILDEASSRLDPATEQQMEEAMDCLLEGKSAMIIAHRLSTLDRADDVLILERGQVSEYGERERLSKDPDSQYSKLLRDGMEEMLA